VLESDPFCDKVDVALLEEYYVCSHVEDIHTSTYDDSDIDEAEGDSELLDSTLLE